jgi:arylsulfatase A-like enzyme
MPSSIPRVALLLAVAGLAGGCGEQARRPSNLLFVCVDTLRADHLGVFGAEPSPSPAIDAFARSSVVFERAYSHAPWTLPSFAAVLTSLYSSSTGTWTKESRLGAAVTTLPERFEAEGFATYGVASHVFFRREFGLLQGFDGFDEELCHPKGEQGWRPITSPEVTARAKRWLAAPERRQAPWLLWVHYFDPHLPYVAHPELGGAPGADERALYRSEIAFTDRHVGELLASLDELGLAGDTVVVFLADHGEAFYEHPGIHRHGFSLFDEELRVPLAIRVPGLAPRRVSAFVRTVDLVPTLCELLGVPLGDAPIEGRSLVGALEGGAYEAPPLLSELRLNEGYHARGLLDGRYKLVEDLSHGGLRLFDLVADPGEAHDLAAERPELVRELAGRMQAEESRAAGLCARFGGASAVQVDDATREQLRALGYGGDEEPRSQGAERPNPGAQER